MSRLVVKFGGTSLQAPSRVLLAARRIAAARRRGLAVAAVVSARGDTTDAILHDLSRLAPRAPHGREWDRALATGEDLSASLLAAALEAREVPSLSLRGGEAGIVAEGTFGEGTIARVEPGPLERLLSRGVVPVVSGYQGARADGETLTLGRGGSDTSAVALAAALGAECHIVTDVPGVFDRDPNAAPRARLLPAVSWGELLRLAESGARVVHPEAARLAQRHRVPLRVFSFDAPLVSDPRGTVVVEREATREEAREEAEVGA